MVNEEMNKTLPQRWREHINAEMGPRGLGDVLKMDSFRSWDQNRMPEVSAENQIGYAIDIACAFSEHEMIQPFLSRALSITRRALAEKPLETDNEMSRRFPGNRGKLLRVEAYAKSLQDGSALDLSKLRQASDDLVADRMLAMLPAEWGNVQQCQYLVAVQLALVCGDVERARSLLKIDCKFEDLQLWIEGLTDLVESLQQAPGALWRASETPESWAEFFDLIRDPTVRPLELVTSKPLLRLEASLITERYITHPSEALDLKRAVAGISQ